MKSPRFHFYFSLILIFCTSNLEAQNDSSCDLAAIQSLSDGGLMNTLKAIGHPCPPTWQASSILRHEVISRLDEIVYKQYYWWNDPRGFEEELVRLKDHDSTDPDLIYLRGLIGIDPMDLLSDSRMNRKAYRGIRDSLFFDDWEILFAFLEVDQDLAERTQVESNISWIANHNSLQYLSIAYQDCLADKNFVSPSVEIRNNDMIAHRLAQVEAEEFVNYKSNGKDLKAVKDIDFNMDNDLFTLGNLNQDRDYTGGGSLTASTDYFAARWLNLGWIKYIGKGQLEKPHSVVMSYQSMRLGMNFYTPYIRYRNNFNLADSLFQHDRPFSSYVYLERSKYRLWPKGLVRHHGALQVGIIGSNLGRDIQSTLHRDATVESQRPYGWDKQIGQGGRWLVQFNHKVDVLLFSTTNKYKSVFAQNWKTKHDNAVWDFFGVNLIGTGSVFFGGYLTAIEGGFKIATTDFTNQSGQNTIRAFKDNDIRTRNRVFEFGINLEAGIRLRHVFHNSMLEGFGYITTYRDDQYDNDAESVYTLNGDFYQEQNRIDTTNTSRYPRTPAAKDQLNRDIWLFDLRLNLRWRKMTVYLETTLHRKEYTVDPPVYNSLIPLLDNPGDEEFYREEVVPELERYNKMKHYGYGRIGVVWLL